MHQALDGAVIEVDVTHLRTPIEGVSIDGEARIKTADRSFRDPFDGFAVVNRGGDYILSRITFHGTK